MEGSCTVCQHYAVIQRGGRPAKTNRTGRPPNICPRYCADHIRAVAPPALTPPDAEITVCEAHLLSEFSCPICCDILRRPIELVTCGNVVCAECLCRWLQHQKCFACPCYADHLFDFSTIKQAPPLVVSMIGSLCTVCDKCNNHLQLKAYLDHTCLQATQLCQTVASRMLSINP